MKAKLLITECQNLVMGFLYEDNTLFEVHSFDENTILGNIYTARVENVVLTMDAAFLSIDGTENCYYSLKENRDRHIFLNRKKENRVSVGDTLLVQVSKEAVKTKRCEVTADLTLSGKYVVVTRNGVVGVSSKIKEHQKRDMLKMTVQEAISDFQADGMHEIEHLGVIVRTNAAAAAPDDLKKETIKLLCKLEEVIKRAYFLKEHTLVSKSEKGYIKFIQQELCSRYDSVEVITDMEAVFQDLKAVSCDVSLYQDNMISLRNVYGIEGKLRKLLARRVYLKSGGYLVVDVTEALTVIDVNSGKAVIGRNHQKHILKVNKEAAAKAAEVLRIRNLSGIIIIDFINMESRRDEQELIDYLKNEICHDSVQTSFIDVTPLGLVELTRKKVRKPLHEILGNKLES